MVLELWSLHSYAFILNVGDLVQNSSLEASVEKVCLPILKAVFSSLLWVGEHALSYVFTQKVNVQFCGGVS